MHGSLWSLSVLIRQSWVRFVLNLQSLRAPRLGRLEISNNTIFRFRPSTSRSYKMGNRFYRRNYFKTTFNGQSICTTNFAMQIADLRHWPVNFAGQCLKSIHEPWRAMTSMWIRALNQFATVRTFACLHYTLPLKKWSASLEWST